jgi:hypothetical protein
MGQDKGKVISEGGEIEEKQIWCPLACPSFSSKFWTKNDNSEVN